MDVKREKYKLDTSGICTWQFAKSKNLNALFELISKYSGIGSRLMSVTTIPMIDINNQMVDFFEFSPVILNLWGMLLGLKRPVLTYADDDESEAYDHELSDDTYRKLLYHRFKLLSCCSSFEHTALMFYDVFNGHVAAKDNLNMTITLVINDEQILKEQNRELYYLLKLYNPLIPYSNDSRLFFDIFLLPVGVGIATKSVEAKIFGLNITQEEGQNLENFTTTYGTNTHGGKFAK